MALPRFSFDLARSAAELAAGPGLAFLLGRRQHASIMLGLLPASVWAAMGAASAPSAAAAAAVAAATATEPQPPSPFWAVTAREGPAARPCAVVMSTYPTPERASIAVDEALLQGSDEALALFAGALLDFLESSQLATTMKRLDGESSVIAQLAFRMQQRGLIVSGTPTMSMTLYSLDWAVFSRQIARSAASSSPFASAANVSASSNESAAGEESVQPILARASAAEYEECVKTHETFIAEVWGPGHSADKAMSGRLIRQALDAGLVFTARAGQQQQQQQQQQQPLLCMVTAKLCCPPDLFRITCVYTAPAARKQRMACRLLQWLLQDLRATHPSADVVLYADNDNPAANALYQRLGFEAIGNAGVHDLFTTYQQS